MVNKSKKILTEISAGELLDKISILEIKLKKIQDKSNQKEINKEYKILKKAQKSNIKLNKKSINLFKELKNINLKLWDIEDKVRIFEKDKNFNEIFVQLAREVYFNNDRRSKIKLEINKIFKSNITEIKKYANY
jgi:hypothetical protein